MIKKYFKLSAISLISLSIAGCAVTKTQVGCTTGLVVGTIIGKQLDKDVGAYVGGALGALVGCSIGHYLDEREKKIALLASQNSLNASFERVSIDTDNTASFSTDATDEVVASAVSVSTEQPLFDTNKATISDQEQLAKLKTFLGGYLTTLDTNSKIYVVGHTDATGTATLNQKLSEQRARFIAEQLVALGAKPERLFYEGVGQSQPIASNDTEDGRARNRRFELHDVMITKNAKSVSVTQVATISTAKKQRLGNVVNDIGIHNKPKVSAAPAATTKTTAIRNPPKQTSVTPTDPLGLGGVLIDKFQLDVIAKLGIPEQERGIFSKAYASDLSIQSCAYAQPVVVSSLHSYSGQKIVDRTTSESLPNLYGTIWWSKVDTTGVVLGPVGIAKDTMQPTKQPIFSFYKNYQGGNPKADFDVPVSVETYRGKDAVLVRMYAKEDHSPFRCSDVVFSIKGEAVTKTTGVIYADNGQLYGREIQLSLVRTQ
ncbi:MAG: OmpA family protein [Paraglaciecola sp.]|nr:OmpA family protein [Paraglaciecola sp.]